MSLIELRVVNYAVTDRQLRLGEEDPGQVEYRSARSFLWQFR